MFSKIEIARVENGYLVKLESSGAPRTFAVLAAKPSDNNPDDAEAALTAALHNGLALWRQAYMPHWRPDPPKKPVGRARRGR